VITWILLGLGTVVTVACAVGALLVRDFYRRLHFLTPITSLGGPLTGMALAVTNGWTLPTAMTLFTIVLLGITGPVLAAATGRVAAQRDGILDEDPLP
jgi:multicomponent Na+:H+ antiporter subunit G